MGFLFAHLSVAGSYSYTSALGFQPGASPANTYILPPAEAPSSSSDGSGNGASLVHLPWASAGPAIRQALNATTALRRLDMTSSYSPALFRPFTARFTTFTGHSPESTRRTSPGAPACSPSMAFSLYHAACGTMMTFSRPRSG